MTVSESFCIKNYWSKILSCVTTHTVDSVKQLIHWCNLTQKSDFTTFSFFSFSARLAFCWGNSCWIFFCRILKVLISQRLYYLPFIRNVEYSVQKKKKSMESNLRRRWTMLWQSCSPQNFLCVVHVSQFHGRHFIPLQGSWSKIFSNKNTRRILVCQKYIMKEKEH